MNTKQKIATVGLLLATIAIIIGAFLLFNHKPNNSSYITDRDTGETYDAKVNDERTGGLSETRDQSVAVLFGIQKFAGTVQNHGYEKMNFTTDVRNATLAFSLKNLHDTYASITLRPQNMIFSKGNISAQLRLGQGNVIIPINIEVIDDGSAALVTIDGGKTNGGKFVYVGGLATIDQTLYTIKQTNFSGPNITVDSFTYREAALDALKNLGYDIPDLNIKFTNYKDPFQ